MGEELSQENRERIEHLRQNPITGPDDAEAEDFGEQLSEVRLQSKEEQRRRKEAEVKDVDRNFEAYLEKNSKLLLGSERILQLLYKGNFSGVGRVEGGKNQLEALLERAVRNSPWASHEQKGETIEVLFTTQQKDLKSIIIRLTEIAGAQEALDGDAQYYKNPVVFVQRQFSRMGISASRFSQYDRSFENFLPRIEQDIERLKAS